MYINELVEKYLEGTEMTEQDVWNEFNGFKTTSDIRNLKYYLLNKR
jgi:hypothetical protein